MSEAEQAGTPPDAAPAGEDPAAGDAPDAQTVAEAAEPASAETPPARPGRTEVREEAPAPGKASGAKAPRGPDLDEKAGREVGDQLAGALTRWAQVTNVTINGSVTTEGNAVFGSGAPKTNAERLLKAAIEAGLLKV